MSIINFPAYFLLTNVSTHDYVTIATAITVMLLGYTFSSYSTF